MGELRIDIYNSEEGYEWDYWRDFPISDPFERYPSVLIEREFAPDIILERGQITNSTMDHVLRVRPSERPGVDIDKVTKKGEPESENLPMTSKPNVHSPVTGEIKLIKQDPWGTVIVEDQNEYQHVLIHNEFASGKGPLNETYFGVRAGDKVQIGQKLGFLSNRSPSSCRDHVHYYITDQYGNLYAPENMIFDPISGAVTGVKSLEDHNRYREEHEFRLEMERHMDQNHEIIHDDNLLADDVSNIA